MTTTTIRSTRLTSPDLRRPTLWGMDAVQLHDRYWATQGVQVVRPGEPAELRDSDLYLLIDSPTLTLFDAKAACSRSGVARPAAWVIRLHDSRRRAYREVVRTNEQNRFVRLERQYSDTQTRCARAALTRDRAIAWLWHSSSDAPSAWKQVRRLIPRRRRVTATLRAPLYQRGNEADLRWLTRELVCTWGNPGAALKNIRQVSPGVWCDLLAHVELGATLVAPVWIGANRRIEAGSVVAGPTILWDGPSNLAAPGQGSPPDLLDAGDPARRRPASSRTPPGKRLFDILFALAALAGTLWLYPLVMLAIWLEDGRPFFFAHRRETRGQRQFPCLKFRSMRKDAEAIKTALARHNRADGPQFFIEDDPRLTRVGRFIRNTNIDELPQFWNVLLGHMSVVGPRPSPRKENQFCPPWREARLSVRPGIVGLWQICRSRAAGLDFQEWIRFDIEYIETQSWRMDLWIIWRSVLLLGLRRKPRVEP